MPLPPDRFMELNGKLDAAEKRLDALIERQKNDPDDDEDDDDDDPEDLEEEEELEDPAEEAMNATPNLDLDSPNSPNNEEPWFS
jgi:hypothetical protein